MIRLGYVKDGVDVCVKTVNSVPESNAEIINLVNQNVLNGIEYFYKERRVSETEWQKYAFVNPL